MSGAQYEYVTAPEAARLLDVSKTKMARLLRSGEILYTSDPRNERAKLVEWSDVDAYVVEDRGAKVAQAQKARAKNVTRTVRTQ